TLLFPFSLLLLLQNSCLDHSSLEAASGEESSPKETQNEKRYQRCLTEPLPSGSRFPHLCPPHIRFRLVLLRLLPYSASIRYPHLKLPYYKQQTIPILFLLYPPGNP